MKDPNFLEIHEHYLDGKLDTIIAITKQKCGCGDKVIKYTETGCTTTQKMCIAHANALKLLINNN